MSPEVQQIKQGNNSFSTKNIVVGMQLMLYIAILIWGYKLGNGGGMHDGLIIIPVYIGGGLLGELVFGYIKKSLGLVYNTGTQVISILLNPAIVLFRGMGFFIIKSYFKNKNITETRAQYNIQTEINSTSSLNNLMVKLEAEGTGSSVSAGK